jgi:beta-glucuronidase
MKKQFTFLVVLLLLAPAVNAQYSIREPKAIMLHGAWSFALDPQEVGEKEEWYRHEKKFDRSFETWDKVDVPHCFSVDPRYRYYTGSAWYVRNFPWQKEESKRVVLHFDAVYYQCSVWINNIEVGSHEGGYTPFCFDVTDILVTGENHIAIEVNNDTWKHGTIPGPKEKGPNTQFPGWLNYGGITRPVYFTIEPATYIENVQIASDVNLVEKTVRLNVKVFTKGNTTVNSSPELTVFLQKRKLSLSWKLRQVGNGMQWEGDAALKKADTRFWSIDEPVLYQLRSIVGSDTVSTSFGVRKIEVKNAQLLLNGEPLRMAGGNRVVDYPGLGSLEPDWLIENDIKAMKEAGMEFQRLAHYTVTEGVLDWADKHGMLIVAEAGNWQLTPEQMDNDTIRAKFKQQFREMVERDWNHPSVIAYSVGNEYLSDTPSGQRWTKDMIAFSKELDHTRLTTFASMRLNPLPKNPEDEASQYVDFVSANIYGNHAVILDNIHRLYPDKPVLISEYGIRADAKDGEEGQISYLDNFLKVIRGRPYVIGASWWTFNDYESRYPGTNTNGYRPWGLVRPDRSARPLYASYQMQMSPLVIHKKEVVQDAGGIRKLNIEITNRNDFPAYTVRKYSIKTKDIVLPVPDLLPGESTTMSIPVYGLEQHLIIEIMKPTGFTIVRQNIDLKND